eukprot:350784-Chlamydomonas_euryale.AAC.2
MRVREAWGGRPAGRGRQSGCSLIKGGLGDLLASQGPGPAVLVVCRGGLEAGVESWGWHFWLAGQVATIGSLVSPDGGSGPR